MTTTHPTIRDAELRAALVEAANRMIRLPAPPVDGEPAVWIPCDAFPCDAIVALPERIVSAVCDDCARDCEVDGCGLQNYEHVLDPDAEPGEDARIHETI